MEAIMNEIWARYLEYNAQADEFIYFSEPINNNKPTAFEAKQQIEANQQIIEKDKPFHQQFNEVFYLKKSTLF